MTRRIPRFSFVTVSDSIIYRKQPWNGLSVNCFGEGSECCRRRQTLNYSTHKQRNENLEMVKEQGIQLLDKFTRDISSKTKQRLLIADADTGPSSHQLREAGRIKSFVQDAIDQYTSRIGERFCINHESIVIIDAEVTSDLRQARVYWCVPFSLLTSSKLSTSALEAITNKMQLILDEHGGVLQGLVHTRMRSYHHHANIKFVPAESSFLREALKDYNI